MNLSGSKWVNPFVVAILVCWMGATPCLGGVEETMTGDGLQGTAGNWSQDAAPTATSRAVINKQVAAVAVNSPNIIVILTDDQGYGDVSSLNPEAKFRTPNMDRLAKEGIVFTNGHCADSVCTPSRYGLLTGRYCWRTIRKSGVMQAEETCLIADGRMTLASFLRDQGYHTAMVGKWHLGMDFPGTRGHRDWSQPIKDMPLDKGFDYFFGVPASLNFGVLAWFEGRYAKVPPTLYTQKKPNDRHSDYRIMPPYADAGKASNAMIEVAPDFVDNQCLTRFTDKAIEWMEGKVSDAKAGRPFFLYLPYTSPHYPVCPLPEFWGQGDCGGYGEFVIETDYQVGRILEFLKTSGLDDNTLIVFTSDNGPESSWEKRIQEFGHDSSGIYREGKRSVYEGGHRVPFIVRWPNGIAQPGRNWDKIVGQVDLLATFAELVGEKLPDNAGEDSQSFAAVLRDPKAAYDRRPLINHGESGGRYAITEGTWKLVMPGGQFKAELYHLSKDPGETRNVAAEYPEKVQTLQQKITKIVVDGRTTAGVPQPNDTGYWKDLTWISEASITVQRADSCVVMDADKARVDKNRLALDFELKHTGTYVVQLICPIKDSKGNPSATLEVDGAPLSDKLNKTYLIEEGIVSEFDKPAIFTETGKHTLSIQSSIAPAKVRLVPQGYVSSRIQISSSTYFDEWIKMHESPEKVAAMAWYKQARFGMFIHWGVYSEAAGSWKGVPIEQGQGPKVAEWIMYAFKIPRQEYKEFAKKFNPDKSFAVNIARLAKDTGMKYVVITSKHHDGFGLFDSAHSDFDIVDASPYEGDLIRELYDACRAEGLDFGIYYSHGHDWADGCDGNYANVKKYNDTLGVPTRSNGKNLWDPSPNTYQEYLENKAYPQIAELIKLLPDLRLIWFDGEGLITEAQAFRFYKMIYEMNPSIIVNRRIGYDFGDYVDAGDNKTPAANELAAKHFETCGTTNTSWGFKAQDHAWKSTHEVLRNFVDIVSKGGNYLLNIGPDGKGCVPEPCVKNFQETGIWVKTNSDAIFGTTRWTTFYEKGSKQKKSNAASTDEFWFSAKGDKVYAMSLAPGAGTMRILSLKKSAGKAVNVRLLGSEQKLKWSQTDEALEIDFTGTETGVDGYAVEVILTNQADHE